MYVRGTWIATGREARFTRAYDVLWLGYYIDIKPWFFIQDEDEVNVYGVGYGEGGHYIAIPKSEITLSLIYPSVLMRVGDSINLGALM